MFPDTNAKHDPALRLPVLTGTCVVVLGDVMLDRYFLGKTSRISPEAPVPAVLIHKKKHVLGGAGNVAANLAGLGCRVHLLGVKGKDAAGAMVTALLDELGCESGLETVPSRVTTTKTRVVALSQQLIRLDEEDPSPVPEEVEAALLRSFAAILPNAQAVILSDYAKGVLTPGLCRNVIDLCRRFGRPIIVDPKGRDWERYRGATCVSPNTGELEAVAGGQMDGDAALIEAARRVRDRYGFDRLLVTRGAEGMALVGKDGSPVLIPSRAREVFDVSGAGDTVIATLAATLGAGLDWGSAARIANTAAGIVVGKLGTKPIFLEELASALDEESTRTESKILPVATAAQRVQAWREKGEKVVFTNGCFDLLHAGHIRLLQFASAQGSRLVVGLNSDDSVKRLKGPSRPILSQQERTVLLSALASVDMVVVFDEDTPYELIRALRPDVLVKGADYRPEQVVGHDLLAAWGGKVALAPLLEGMSTTGIVERVKNGLP